MALTSTGGAASAAGSRWGCVDTAPQTRILSRRRATPRTDGHVETPTDAPSAPTAAQALRPSWRNARRERSVRSAAPAFVRPERRERARALRLHVHVVGLLQKRQQHGDDDCAAARPRSAPVPRASTRRDSARTRSLPGLAERDEQRLRAGRGAQRRTRGSRSRRKGVSSSELLRASTHRRGEQILRHRALTVRPGASGAACVPVACARSRVSRGAGWEPRGACAARAARGAPCALEPGRSASSATRPTAAGARAQEGNPSRPRG